MESDQENQKQPPPASNPTSQAGLTDDGQSQTSKPVSGHDKSLPENSPSRSLEEETVETTPPSSPFTTPFNWDDEFESHEDDLKRSGHIDLVPVPRSNPVVDTEDAESDEGDFEFESDLDLYGAVPYHYRAIEKAHKGGRPRTYAGDRRKPGGSPLRNEVVFDDNDDTLAQRLTERLEKVQQEGQPDSPSQSQSEVQSHSPTTGTLESPRGFFEERLFAFQPKPIAIQTRLVGNSVEETESRPNLSPIHEENAGAGLDLEQRRETKRLLEAWIDKQIERYPLKPRARSKSLCGIPEESNSASSAPQAGPIPYSTHIERWQAQLEKVYIDTGTQTEPGSPGTDAAVQTEELASATGTAPVAAQKDDLPVEDLEAARSPSETDLDASELSRGSAGSSGRRKPKDKGKQKRPVGDPEVRQVETEVYLNRLYNTNGSVAQGRTIQDLENKVKELELENASIRMALQANPYATNVDVDTVQSKLVADQLHTLEDQAQQAEHVIRTYQSEIEARVEERDALSQRSGERDEKLEVVMTANANLQAEKEALLAENETLLADKTAMEAEIEALRRDKAEIEEETENLEGVAEMFEEQKEQAEKRLETTLVSCSKIVQRKVIDHHRVKLFEEIEVEADLEQKLRITEGERDSAEDAINDADTQKTAAEETACLARQEQEKAEEVARETQKKLEEARAATVEAQRQLRGSEEAVKKLKEDLEAAQATTKRIQDDQQRQQVTFEDQKQQHGEISQKTVRVQSEEAGEHSDGLSEYDSEASDQPPAAHKQLRQRVKKLNAENLRLRHLHLKDQSFVNSAERELREAQLKLADANRQLANVKSNPESTAMRHRRLVKEREDRDMDAARSRTGSLPRPPWQTDRPPVEVPVIRARRPRNPPHQSKEHREAFETRERQLRDKFAVLQKAHAQWQMKLLQNRYDMRDKFASLEREVRHMRSTVRDL